MRAPKQILIDLVRKPPMIMPMIAIAHILWLVWTVWGNRLLPFGSIEWLQALWLVAYTVFWLAACDLKRWGAIGYLLLSVGNITIYLLVKDVYMRQMYLSNLFIVDVLFSFFLMFSFKKFS